MSTCSSAASTESCCHTSARSCFPGITPGCPGAMDLSWGALSHGLVSWHWHSCKTSSSQPCALRFSFPRAAGWDAPGGRAWPGRGLGTSVLWAGWRWASGGSGSRGTVTGLVTAHSRVGHTCPAPSQVRVCISHSQRRPQGPRHWGTGLEDRTRALPRTGKPCEGGMAQPPALLHEVPLQSSCTLCLADSSSSLSNTG